ncbi:MBL fold metallo-hydrolase [Streptomyces massasporeus]|uniref:MBL fold metallo-hydrolase n=1 Tax=Streptomyces massasporeus TaxID=67324 RepID=UPI00345154D4
MVDTGFVGHADETAAWDRTHAGNVDLVVNTHWHSDHVGDNALLHAQGSAIAAGTPGGRRDHPPRPRLLRREEVPGLRAR